MGWGALRWVRRLGLAGILGGLIYLYVLLERPSPLRILVVAEAAEGLEGGPEIARRLRRALNATLSEAGFEVISRLTAEGSAAEVAARRGALFWLEARPLREHLGRSPDGRETQARVIGALRVGAVGRAPLEVEFEGNGRVYLPTSSVTPTIDESKRLAVESAVAEIIAKIYPYVSRNYHLDHLISPRVSNLPNFQEIFDRIEGYSQNKPEISPDFTRGINNLKQRYPEAQVYPHKTRVLCYFGSDLVLISTHLSKSLYDISQSGDYKQNQTTSIHYLKGDHLSFTGWQEFQEVELSFKEDFIFSIESDYRSRKTQNSYISMIKKDEKSAFKCLGGGRFQKARISKDGKYLAVVRHRLNYDRLNEYRKNERSRRIRCGNARTKRWDKLYFKSTDSEILVFEIESGELLWTRPASSDFDWINHDQLLIFGNYYKTEHWIDFPRMPELGNIRPKRDFPISPFEETSVKALVKWSRAKGERFIKFTSFEHYVKLLGSEDNIVFFTRKDKLLPEKFDVCALNLITKQEQCFDIPYKSRDLYISNKIVTFTLQSNNHVNRIGLIDLNKQKPRVKQINIGHIIVNKPKVIKDRVHFLTLDREAPRYPKNWIEISIPINQSIE